MLHYLGKRELFSETLQLQIIPDLKQRYFIFSYFFNKVYMSQILDKNQVSLFGIFYFLQSLTTLQMYQQEMENMGSPRICHTCTNNINEC